MISCPYCSSIDQRKKGFSERTGLQRYQCLGCRRQYTTATIPKPKRDEKPHFILCPECGKETTNPKFCSSSCFASYTNRVNPRRKRKPKFCKICGVQIFPKQGSGQTLCESCRGFNVDWSKRTVADIQKSAKYQISAALRDVARRSFKQSGRPRVCQNCGYDTHVEICHIRAIQDFPDDTPVSVVSGIDNLVALCPNCHWEFDVTCWGGKLFR